MAESVKIKVPYGMVELRVSNRNHVQCQICAKYPNIVNQFNPRKPLAIASEKGTKVYSRVVDNHVNSDCHKACLEADRVNSVKSADREKTSMEVSIRKANAKQIGHIGKLMIQIYTDANLMNMSAYSWPARYVGGEASVAYKPESQSSSIIADNIKLQYVNPVGHLEILSTITKSYQGEFMEKINEAWTVSLRVDGSAR